MNPSLVLRPPLTPTASPPTVALVPLRVEPLRRTQSNTRADKYLDLAISLTTYFQAPLPLLNLDSYLLSAEMSTHTYKFNVKMSCGGCSGAVSRALTKAEAVGDGNFEVDLEEQKVVVRSAADYETVRSIISKTGKEVISGETLP